MATATRRRRTTKPVQEPEIDEELDIEPEDDEEPEAKPARRTHAKTATASKRRASAVEDEGDDEPAAKPTKIQFGTQWLVDYINETLETELDGKAIRVLLRKMVADEILDEFEGRYSFTGPNDKRVRLILKEVRANEKASATDDEKPRRGRPAAKATATAKPAAKTTTRRTRKPAPEPVEDVDAPDEDDDLDDL